MTDHLGVFRDLRAAGILLGLLLTSCAGTQATRGDTGHVWPYPEPPVVEPSAPGQQGGIDTAPAGEEPSPTTPEAVGPSAPTQNAAVTALMQQARTQLNAGQPDQAAILLERAQRIEPRNALVWSMLAQTRLVQQRYAEADSMARKSNSLSRGDPYVAAENWRIIANARRGLGDETGAAEAEAQAEALQQGR